MKLWFRMHKNSQKNSIASIVEKFGALKLQRNVFCEE